MRIKDKATGREVKSFNRVSAEMIIAVLESQAVAELPTLGRKEKDICNEKS